jgi:restriction endonuclease S subunit
MYGATAGQVGVLKISSSTNQAVCGILPNDRVWAGFLYRVLQSRVSYLVLQSTGGAQPNISQTVIRNLNIPLPSIGEQQRIAAKLDEQMAALDRAEQALSEQEAAASAFTTAVLQQVFCGLESGRWPQVQLGEVAASDLTQVRPDDEFAKDLPYVGMEDIESQTGRIIAPSAHSDIRSNTFAFNERHVLYGKLRPYLNKVALPESRGRCSTELVPLLPKAGLDRRYLVWFLRRPETVSAAMQEKTGSRMPRASMRNIAQLRIPLPPLSHQKRVVTSLERVSAELTSLQQHFADQRMDLAALRSSLLNAAFSGEI